MAGSKRPTHVSVRGEHGLPVRVPIWDMEQILEGARARVQAEISDATDDATVQRKIRAYRREGVRRWAQEHDVAFAPDE